MQTGRVVLRGVKRCISESSDFGVNHNSVRSVGHQAQGAAMIGLTSLVTLMTLQITNVSVAHATGRLIKST